MQMSQLPAEFITATRRTMGEERFERYCRSFEEEAPVSIRLNPLKPAGLPVGGEQVAWCADGFYLSARPNFTLDPLFHAGCYYVQEASSMFIGHVLQQYLPQHPVKALDLCAAPGGKSTLMRAMLPAGSGLCSNEPVRNRAQILAENMLKWGYDNCIVTNAMPHDYRRAKLTFDVILCDVPCSGEGMFRKDAATMAEWSPQNVERCAALQRSIVADAWSCLSEGGLLIYSTCTLNTKENEENIRHFTETLGAEVLPVDTCQQWGITASLLKGFHMPVYRFIPGFTRGEGLFVCALRKGNSGEQNQKKQKRSHYDIVSTALRDKIIGGKTVDENGQPTIAAALRTSTDHSRFASVELGYEQAIQYLRREAITLPEGTPRGIVLVTFMNQPLGFAKNIGTRANNLYPKEWKIKTTHITKHYEAILRRA